MRCSTVHDGRADVVDELIFDEMFAIPDRIEGLAHGERRHRMLADQLERFLIPGRRRISARTAGTVRDREQAARLRSAKADDARRAGVRCPTVIMPQTLEQLRHERQVLRRGPHSFGGQLALRGFIRGFQARDSVRLLIPGTPHRARTALCPGRCTCPPRAALVDILAIRMATPRTFSNVRRAVDLTADSSSCRKCPTTRHRPRQSPSSSQVRGASTSRDRKLPDVFDTGIATDEIGTTVLRYVACTASPGHSMSRRQYPQYRSA